MFDRDMPVLIWSRTRDFNGVNVTTSYQLRERFGLELSKAYSYVGRTVFSGELTPLEKI